jgi:hypothetical protein
LGDLEQLVPLLRRSKLDLFDAFDIAPPSTLWAANNFAATHFGQADVAENVLAW